MLPPLALLPLQGAVPVPVPGARTATPLADRIPGFSWETLPVHWFSSNATSQLSAEAAERIASRHSLAIINGQSHAYWEAPSGRGAEGKMMGRAAG